MIQWILLGALVVAILLTIAAWSLLRRKVHDSRDRNLLLMLWGDLESQKLSPLKLVEAEHILDTALERMGFSGTLESRLEAAKEKFSDVDSLLRAHSLSMSIVESSKTQFPAQEIEKGIKAYEQALKDLGVLASA